MSLGSLFTYNNTSWLSKWELLPLYVNLLRITFFYKTVEEGRDSIYVTLTDTLLQYGDTKKVTLADLGKQDCNLTSTNFDRVLVTNVSTSSAEVIISHYYRWQSGLSNPDHQTTRSTVTPGLKPFTVSADNFSNKWNAIRSINEALLTAKSHAIVSRYSKYTHYYDWWKPLK